MDYIEITIDFDYIQIDYNNKQHCLPAEQYYLCFSDDKEILIRETSAETPFADKIIYRFPRSRTIIHHIGQ